MWLGDEVVAVVAVAAVVIVAAVVVVAAVVTVVAVPLWNSREVLDKNVQNHGTG